jgi:hypothetical protein
VLESSRCKSVRLQNPNSYTAEHIVSFFCSLRIYAFIFEARNAHNNSKTKQGTLERKRQIF